MAYERDTCKCSPSIVSKIYNERLRFIASYLTITFKYFFFGIYASHSRYVKYCCFTQPF